MGIQDHQAKPLILQIKENEIQRGKGKWLHGYRANRGGSYKPPCLVVLPPLKTNQTKQRQAPVTLRDPSHSPPVPSTHSASGMSCHFGFFSAFGEYRTL